MLNQGLLFFSEYLRKLVKCRSDFFQGLSGNGMHS